MGVARIVVRDRAKGAGASRSGMTLVEALVVATIVSALAGLLLPRLHSAREQARTVYCASQLRQLVTANAMYADGAHGQYCPGASEHGKNLNRWHGARSKVSESFSVLGSPLLTFLGGDVGIKECPSFPALAINGKGGGFERGCGGYGYNLRFLGRQTTDRPDGTHAVTSDRAGERVHRVRRPGETAMFGDTAFAGASLIEYSFLEPRFHPEFTGYRADPSIHFRHAGRANLAWCDGHVDVRERTFTWRSGFYSGSPERHGLGWFGDADDNGFFDLK